MYPKAPLLGLGFSLGGNLLARYVAEEGDQCRLISACALGTVRAVRFHPSSFRSKHTFLALGLREVLPMVCLTRLLRLFFKLTAHFPCTYSLEGTWFSRLIYSKSLGTNLKNLLNSHRDSIHSFPDTNFARELSTLSTQSRVRANQIDTLITIKFGGSSPPFPFPDTHAYYVYSSSYNKLDRIRIPFLAFHADDDPIASGVPRDYDDNEWFTLVLTRGGGHLGWFEAKGRWVRRPVLEWLKATAEDVKVIPRNVREIECRDGWLVEIGSEHLGCREIGGGGTIQGTDGLNAE